MEKAYLFSFSYWYNDPPKYLLIYAKNEDKAREIACENLYYNSGKKANPRDVILCTFGI